jgi:ABC-2 type transport system permease protein
MNRIRWLIYKEFIQIRRDRRLLQILIIAPVIQLIFLGFAATTDIREIAVAVRDYDRTYESREYVRAIGASGYLKTTMLEGTSASEESALVSGKAGLVLVIPADFGKNLNSRREAPVQVLVDGSDSNFAVQGLNYLQKATRLFSQRMARTVSLSILSEKGISLPGITAQIRVWYNPDLTSTNYMLPAIMGVLLLVVTTLVTSMALVKEREEGTMEQLIITPLRPIEIIAGKLLPFAAIGLAEITLALLVVTQVFGVPLKGSVLLLYVLASLFLTTTLGLGLLISTMVHTQQQAMLVAGFGVLMPFVLLSGFIFPVENMPAPIHAVTYFIPLRYFLDIVRSLFLKGCGLRELWPDALALIACGIAILSLAVLKFHKRMD